MGRCSILLPRLELGMKSYASARQLDDGGEFHRLLNDKVETVQCFRCYELSRAYYVPSHVQLLLSSLLWLVERANWRRLVVFIVKVLHIHRESTPIL